ncbi:Fur family transcriptional regulator [Silvibacterium sp.]|uniref:Fur family transcriptional regulator n=1 Tax=Silvibacterium sp. TaxID=1964179 RepID=UPI0039E6A257
MPEANRNTKQKAAIHAAFEMEDRPLTPEEVQVLAQKEGASVSLATIYRNINSLLEEGWLQSVGLPGMPSRYEIAGKAHHHHFYCDACGKLFELKGCGMPKISRLPEGFRAVSHEVIVHGLCDTCG